MEVRQIFGILAAFVVLAGVSVAIVNGDMTAKILTSSGEAFSSIVKASTLQK